MNNTSKTRQGLLRAALLGNAAFSAFSGLAIVFANDRIVSWLGLPAKINLLILGFGLVAFAAGLYANARRPQIKLKNAQVAVVMDVAWVLASVVLIAILPFSRSGSLLVAGIAEIVLTFAILQWLGIRRIRQGQPMDAHPA